MMPPSESLVQLMVLKGWIYSPPHLAFHFQNTITLTKIIFQHPASSIQHLAE